MLADLGEDCRLMAGGTALMLAMRQRMLVPGSIVSLARLDSLRGIEWDPQQGLRIGSLCKHSEVASSPLVRQHHPVLAAMAAGLANPQVRNQGTLGGNLCYADPATDPPGCLMALGASVVLAGAKGQRTLAMQDFLVDYYTTALEPDEVLVAVLVPPLAADGRAHYQRFLRTAAEHRPLVNVSLVVRLQGATCIESRFVVGASVAVPARVAGVEEILAGKKVTRDLIEEAANAAAQGIDAISDMRGSAEFRRDMVRVVAQRSLCAVFGLPTD